MGIAHENDNFADLKDNLMHFDCIFLPRSFAGAQTTLLKIQRLKHTDTLQTIK